MTDKTTWGYRKADNEQGYEAKLFADGLPARGWADSPAKFKVLKNADNS